MQPEPQLLPDGPRPGHHPGLELRGLLPRRRRRRPRQPSPPRFRRRRRFLDDAARILPAGGLLCRLVRQGLPSGPAAQLRLPPELVGTPGVPGQVQLPVRGLPSDRQVRDDGLPLRGGQRFRCRRGPGGRRRGRAVRRPHAAHAGRLGRDQPLPPVLPRRGFPVPSPALELPCHRGQDPLPARRVGAERRQAAAVPRAERSGGPRVVPARRDRSVQRRPGDP